MNVILFKHSDNKRYKTMPDYKQGKIYAIRSYQTDQVYIGSTAQPLYKRLYAHKIDYKNWMNGKYHYVSSFEIVKYNDAFVELIEDYSCENVNQLRRREGEIIRQTENCINKRVECQTKKEYREQNKGKIAQRDKKYRETNKEKIAQKRKEWLEKNEDYVSRYLKEYVAKNKEQLSQKWKEYRDRNKDEINRKKRIYESKIVQCECGNSFRIDNLSKHLKTQIHYDNMIGLSAFGF